MDSVIGFLTNALILHPHMILIKSRALKVTQEGEFLLLSSTRFKAVYKISPICPPPAIFSPCKEFKPTNIFGTPDKYNIIYKVLLVWWKEKDMNYCVERAYIRIYSAG